MPNYTTVFTASYIPTSCGEINLHALIKFINVLLIARPRPLPLELVSQGGLNP